MNFQTVLIIQKLLIIYHDAFRRLKDISSPDMSTSNFNPGPFNPEPFNHELFNHEFLNHGIEKFTIEKSWVEMKVKRTFQPQNSTTDL